MRANFRRSRPFLTACFSLLTCSLLFHSAAAAAQPSLPPIEGLPFQLVPFDKRDIVAGHPRLFFSPEEIERARKLAQDDAAYRRILEKLRTEADHHLELELKPLDESWWEADKNKPWAETYPQIFQHTMREPLVYASAANTLATAWLLTDEAAYEDKAEKLLLHLTSYRFLAEHYDVGMNYAIWLLHALRAYDVLLPEFSTANRERIDAMFTRGAWAVANNDVYWIKNDIGGGLNNHLAWHKMMLGLLGLFYDRPEMVEFCLHGPRGLVPLLEDGLLDDGLWVESSLVYHFTAIVPMAIFADAQNRMGASPTLFDLVLANGRTLKQPFDAMFNVLAPDGLIPPIGDAYATRARLWNQPIYEYAWSAWRDPRHAWLLAKAKERPVQALFSPPLPQEVAAPPVRSILLPEHGYVFLRSHDDNDYWDNPDARCAFLTYDRSHIHSNADKLSLMLFGQNRLLLSDVEGRATVPHAFSSRIQGELNRGGLSHNTVMIDGQDQRGAGRLLRLVEYRDTPREKRATAADEEGLLYEGVRQMRTICMTPEYVLDVFQVNCGQKSRQIDWIVHVMDEKATAPPEHNPVLAELTPFDLPKTGAWQWLKNARSNKGVRKSPDKGVEKSFDKGVGKSSDEGVGKSSDEGIGKILRDENQGARNLFSDENKGARNLFRDGLLAFDWRSEGARLRLKLLDPGAERVIACGYPASDEPDAGTIPMLIVRRQANTAVFAALWLVGDAVNNAELKPLPVRPGYLVYEVHVDGRPQRHLVPALP